MGCDAGCEPKTATVRITTVEAGAVRLHLASPPRDLAAYVSLFYRTDIAAGHVVEDCVPPELANLRAARVGTYEAAIGGAPMARVPELLLAGPTSRAARLRIGEGSYWGIGLLPLGFAKFLGLPASDHADRFSDIAIEPAAAPLHALLEQLVAGEWAMEDAVKLMTRSLRALLDRPLPQAEAILAAHQAVVSNRPRSVAELARQVGVSPRTLERFSRRAFGFNPQLLLRRQRFLRSLASFMVDPTMRWVETLDTHYHDQAHFVRDFRSFMGMNPSEYAAMPHPIIATAVRARRSARGEAMQVLHEPDRPLSDP